MANTVIQLKHSTVTDKPTQLNIGEPAYSYTSNTLFIGTADGLSTVNIGGLFYTTQIDDATDANTASKLVKRDINGSFSATTVRASLFGNANTATALQTARNFSIDGVDVESSAVSFDGTGAVVLQGNLKTTGVSSGTYGGASQIPTFTVDNKGRLSFAANVAISTSLQVAADTGANTIALATDTITFVGGDGITTSIDPTSNVKIDVDNTVIRTTGDQTIGGNLNITGNLNVSGNVVTVGAEDLIINDPIIVLANNNTTNLMDIGFVGKYANNGDQKELGLVHHASSDKFYLFTDYEGAVEATNILNIADPTVVTATLVANIEGGTVSNLSSAINVADGGTGATTFTSGGIVIGNGTGALGVLANTSSSGSYGNASHTVAFTVDNYGRVSAAANTPIAIDTTAITSGTLPIARGGTNQTTYTTGNIVVFDGTSLNSLANTDTAGTYANASHVPVITTDALGRVTTVANTPIAIDTSAITSGILGVTRGGTGAGTFTTNGVLLGQGTGAFTTASSTTEGHLLTINNSGVPTFQHLQGGTF
jgi:hypothetical protein